jgi:hypothetical protein
MRPIINQHDFDGMLTGETHDAFKATPRRFKAIICQHIHRECADIRLIQQ